MTIDLTWAGITALGTAAGLLAGFGFKWGAWETERKEIIADVEILKKDNSKLKEDMAKATNMAEANRTMLDELANSIVDTRNSCNKAIDSFEKNIKDTAEQFRSEVNKLDDRLYHLIRNKQP